MSNTFEICCTQCRVKLWIGQRGAGSDEPWIYNEPLLAPFLNDHMGHPLVYDGDWNEDLWGFEEYKPAPVEAQGDE